MTSAFIEAARREFDRRLSGYRAFFESCPKLREWIMEEFDQALAIAKEGASGKQTLQSFN